MKYQKSEQSNFLRIGIALCLFSHGSAHAVDLGIAQRNLSPLELFNRCYSHLTQLNLSTNHPLRAQVASGALAPVDACMRVLSSANLNSSGTIANTTTVNGINESQAVLKTFNEYHRNLTETPDLTNSLPNGTDHNGTRFIYDEGEFGLHFTRALFGNGAKASDVVLLNSEMEAIRSNGTQSGFPHSSDRNKRITIPTVQIGNFLGVRLLNSNAEKANLNLNLDGRNYPIHQSEGGGVLGTLPYLMANNGRTYGQTTDGGLVIPRRYSKAIYKDLLCRDLPVIRPSDGVQYVQAQTSANTPAFRRASSCMQCHASMDPMAGVARNYTFYVSVDTTSSVHLYKWGVAKPAESAPVDSDFDFFQRPPNGRLRFRSYSGELIDAPVSSIADLGTQIAATEDYYACAASKYFHFFTGIKANLRDGGDTSQPALSAGDQYYRNEVIRLGKNLKTSQNFQSLIREILMTETYQKASLRKAP